MTAHEMAVRWIRRQRPDEPLDKWLSTYIAEAKRQGYR